MRIPFIFSTAAVVLLLLSCGKEEFCFNGNVTPTFKVIFVDANSNDLLEIDPDALAIDNARIDATYTALASALATNFTIQADTICIQTDVRIGEYTINYNGQEADRLIVFLEEEQVIDCNYFYRIQTMRAENESTVCENEGAFLVKIPI
ncbi:MAG: hypothetical protein AAF985_00475 [Bacteroidota bacterium]